MSLEKKYELLVRLLTHYSSRTFIARAALLTFIVAGSGYLLGVPMTSAGIGATKPTVDPEQLAWFALVIGVIWILELGYFKKYNMIILVGRDLDRLNDQGPSFFTEYRPFTHASVYVAYSIAIVVALGLSIYKNVSLGSAPGTSPDTELAILVGGALVAFLSAWEHVMSSALLWVTHKTAERESQFDDGLGLSPELLAWKKVLYGIVLRDTRSHCSDPPLYHVLRIVGAVICVVGIVAIAYHHPVAGILAIVSGSVTVMWQNPWGSPRTSRISRILRWANGRFLRSNGSMEALADFFERHFADSFEISLRESINRSLKTHGKLSIDFVGSMPSILTLWRALGPHLDVDASGSCTPIALSFSVMDSSSWTSCDFDDILSYVQAARYNPVSTRIARSSFPEVISGAVVNNDRVIGFSSHHTRQLRLLDLKSEPGRTIASGIQRHVSALSGPKVRGLEGGLNRRGSNRRNGNGSFERDRRQSLADRRSPFRKWQIRSI